MKTKQDVLTRLTALNACREALEWVEAQDGTPQEIWDRCEQGDWMLWVAARLGVDRKLIVRAAALCAREALVYVPAGEDRPRVCIETVLAWTRDEATIEDMEQVRGAAWTSAWNAAGHARWAARAAADAAVDWAASMAARSKSLKRSANIVRTIITKVPA